MKRWNCIRIVSSTQERALNSRCSSSKHPHPDSPLCWARNMTFDPSASLSHKAERRAREGAKPWAVTVLSERSLQPSQKECWGKMAGGAGASQLWLAVKDTKKMLLSSSAMASNFYVSCVLEKRWEQLTHFFCWSLLCLFECAPMQLHAAPQHDFPTYPL